MIRQERARELQQSSLATLTQVLDAERELCKPDDVALRGLLGEAEAVLSTLAQEYAQATTPPPAPSPEAALQASAGRAVGFCL
jgi:hypothetical protein